MLICIFCMVGPALCVGCQISAPSLSASVFTVSSSGSCTLASCFGDGLGRGGAAFLGGGLGRSCCPSACRFPPAQPFSLPPLASLKSCRLPSAQPLMGLP